MKCAPSVMWFTGLSGSGKTTTALALKAKLEQAGHSVCVLDGDVLRQGLCSDLGFSKEDRIENNRRAAEVAKLMLNAGQIVLVAFISPFAQERDKIRASFSEYPFIEVFFNTPLEVCEKRDPKGLYKKARAGQLADFTGIHSPFEAPKAADITVNTALMDTNECAQTLFSYLLVKNTLKNACV